MEEAKKGRIVTEGDITRYFDKEGNELHEGDMVINANGKKEVLYLTEDGTLGTDATNPSWIEKGMAYPCEFGIYELTDSDMAEILKVNY